MCFVLPPGGRKRPAVSEDKGLGGTANVSWDEGLDAEEKVDSQNCCTLVESMPSSLQRMMEVKGDMTMTKYEETAI